jgi:uncharacterized protein DUF6335
MARKPARKAGGRKSSAKRTTSRASARGKTRKAGAARRGTRRSASARSAGAGRARKATGKVARKKPVKAARKTAKKTRSVKTPTTAKRSAAPTVVKARQAPSLQRERKRLRDVEETLLTPPSSLDLDRHASAARTGRATIRQARQEHTETSPALTGGDVDADWEDAYAVGDEAPGGDNPTPDQDRVDDIGKALGIEYQDNEELKGSDKVASRDKHRWELDPASSEDYPDRD